MTIELNSLNQARLNQIRRLDPAADVVECEVWRARAPIAAQIVRLDPGHEYVLKNPLSICAVREDGSRFHLGSPEGDTADAAVLARWRTLRAYDFLSVSRGTGLDVFRRLPGAESGWSLWGVYKDADQMTAGVVAGYARLQAVTGEHNLPELPAQPAPPSSVLLPVPAKPSSRLDAEVAQTYDELATATDSEKAYRIYAYVDAKFRQLAERHGLKPQG